jgi:flagellar biogenesis protein FliO
MKNKILALCACLLCAPLVHAENKDPLPQEQMQTAPEPAPVPAPAQAVPETPAPTPSAEEMTHSYENAFLRMIITLLALLVLVFATFWILRRLSGGKFKLGSSRSINVLEKRVLSPKSILYIIEVGGKKILISESQAEVRALARIDEGSCEITELE